MIETRQTKRPPAQAAQLETAATERVERIRAASAAAERCVRSALAHARDAGELLAEAKSAAGHGEWLAWLADNLPEISARTAQGYMRLAARWDEINASNACSGVSHLSIRGALDLLAEPRAESGAIEAPRYWRLTDGDGGAPEVGTHGFWSPPRDAMVDVRTGRGKLVILPAAEPNPRGEPCYWVNVLSSADPDGAATLDHTEKAVPGWMVPFVLVRFGVRDDPASLPWEQGAGSLARNPYAPEPAWSVEGERSSVDDVAGLAGAEITAAAGGPSAMAKLFAEADD